MTSYDYIIVGAGSAGAALARKLSDLDVGSILVLEAGGDGNRSAIQDPRLWPTLWDTDVDWGYKTVQQRHTADRVHDWPRGRVIGGTSCLNAMQFIRGHRSDFNAWAAAGNTGWDWESVLPLFIELEDFEEGASELHGAGGPMYVSTLKNKGANPISETFVRAAVEVGYPENHDHNGAELEGAGWNPTSIREGVRQDSGRAFLTPILDRSNVTLRANTSVKRVVVEGGRAIAVELSDGELIRADREVILSAGALDSPRLLLQSGIGPADELADLGIESIVDLPGVGANLHDHLLLGVVYEASRPIPEGRNNLSESVLFWKSSPDLAGPDIQIAAIHVPFHSTEFTAPAGSYTIAPGILRPRARGRVSLTTSDPGGPLSIDPNYLGDEADVQGLIAGIRLSREIGESAAFDEWRLREVLPGPEVVTEDDLRDYVAKAASTYYHPAGTCKMGDDAQAVVDARLRVHGVEGLRIADASIMPTIVSANPNATIVLIGYKLGEILAEEAAPAPAEIVPESAAS